MNLRFFLVLLLLSGLCLNVLQAQPDAYNFSKVDIENGLSHNQVFSIYRDSTGFVWFGTASGLNRYDGYVCKVFANVPGDSASLPDNYVADIFPLPESNLWIGSKATASIFDPTTEAFDSNSRSYLKSHALPQDKLVYALADKRGNYWFLFEKEGLYRYTTASHTTVHFNGDQTELFQNPIVHMCLDAAGNLWLVCLNGDLLQLDIGSLKKIKTISVLRQFFGGGAYAFRVAGDRQGRLWAYVDGTPKGVFEIDPVAQTVRHFHKDDPVFRLNDNLVKSVAQDKKGALWVGTDRGGINVIDAADPSKITYLLNKENDKNSLSYNSIERLYADNRGVVWAGTGKKGISYLNENINQFEVYRHAADDKNSLPYNDVTYFTEDHNGNMWIGTDGGGLLYFDRSSHKFTRYLHDPKNTNSLSSDVVVSLCLDHENKLWIGTYLGGLDVFDGKTFTHYRHNPADPTSIADDRIWHILEDHSGVVWIGTLKNGVSCFNRQAKTFTRYYFPNLPNTPQAKYIPVMREDSKGKLWVGTWEGIVVLNKERTKYTWYQHTSNPCSISSQNILDIAEDKRGLMWIGTRNGLDVLNTKTGIIKRFCTSDGLPDNVISTIAQDKGGNLWLSTPKGLCQLLVEARGDDVTFDVRNFTASNNVQGPVFNESASLTSADGHIFEGGSTGFNIIDPAKIVATKSKPDLVFTSIEIFNNEVAVGQAINKNVILRKALPFADEIRLRYNENIFSIEFAALDFSGNNQYAYKLDGFNKNWMYTSSGSRKVTYTNLDPGTYVFKVKATNSDGTWSNAEKTLKVVITPPFWKTPLALFLYLLAAAGLLYLARRYTLEKAHMQFEVERQRKERERVQELDAVKTKFFTNVSHEFRTPLSLILTPLERIITHTADPEQKKHLQLVQRNAKRLLNLVNQLLDFRKLEVQAFKLQPTEGDLVRFVKESCCSFSDVSEMKRIRLSFSANTQSLLTHFDKDKLEKILFNLLSNAFKYTPADGMVAVQVAYCESETAGEEVKIIVRDSGIGIPENQQEKVFEPFFQNDVPANTTNSGTGIGLAITKEFVKLHNGTIHIASVPQQGTVFTITLPLPKPGIHPKAVEESPEVILPRNETKTEALLKPAPKPKSTILLVEDNDEFRFYLKDNLMQRHEVVETVNGQDAWERLTKVTPDLIVSDVMMPYMDGIELTKRIKNAPALTSIPIILLTAAHEQELQLESYDLGVRDFMTKPFSYEILDSRIRNILAQASTTPQKVVAVHPSLIEIQPADEQFLKQVLEVIEKNMCNPEFTVEELSKELFMHRAGMYRKLLALTGLSPLEFIRDMRLKRSRQLLEKSGMTIAEVAYEVGFNNPKKFSQHFKEVFGVTPSQFQKQEKSV